MSTIPTTTAAIVEASIEVLDHPAAGHRSAHIRTGIFPIIHAVGIKRELLDKHWWLAASVYEAFRQAKRLAEAEFGESAALKIGLPRINAEFEETSRIMGKDFWPCGVAQNDKALSTMARYSYEQDLAARLLTVEEMFGRGQCERDECLVAKPLKRRARPGGIYCPSVATSAHGGKADMAQTSLERRS